MSNGSETPKIPDRPMAQGGERRRLEQAPGDRIAPATGAGAAGPAAGDPVRTRWGVAPIVIAVLVADLCAVLFFVLGLLDIGIGLVVVAAFSGWVTALALVWHGRAAAVPQGASRVAVAAFLGGWAVFAGMLIDWIYALMIGGVLGPIDYWAQRYGVVAGVALLVAAAVAAVRVR